MRGRNMPWNGLLVILATASMLILMIGCEGDTGPAGADGTDGTDGLDGNVTCLGCHSTESMSTKIIQYARSGHSLGSTVDYAGGRGSCGRCHSGPGFEEYMTTGGVDGDFNTAEPIDCQSCHSVHTTFASGDFALRTTAAVTMLADTLSTFDFGDNSNLCANCHQSRRAEPNIDVPDTTFEITSTHYGPHHGPQANVLNGSGFAEIAGSFTYPTGSVHLDAGATCVTCHMGTYTDGEGGHSWWPSLAACLNCHTGLADFDRNNVQTAIQAQLDDLRDLLVTAGVIEYVEADDAYEPIVLDPVVPVPMAYAQAFFNWIGLTEDRSLGVHNPQYVKALLTNSIEAMTPVP